MTPNKSDTALLFPSQTAVFLTRISFLERVDTDRNTQFKHPQYFVFNFMKFCYSENSATSTGTS